jgi:vancomycin resistance protein VanW
MRKPLSLYHPALYWARVWQKRFFRTLHWRFSERKYAWKCNLDNLLPFRHIKHTSKLIRQLGNTDLLLQENKVVNLNLAIQAINGLIIAPNEYFSFCKLIGKPTKKRGYLEGMELSFGEARRGIGGGICQLSNLIHWIALHSPLSIVERSNHSFDPFPDDNRVLPFGSGAAIFYNYIDLVLFNPTQQYFQLTFNININKNQLEGELLSNELRSVKYHVYQKNHRFHKQGNIVYRGNEIWRDITTKEDTPRLINSELLYRNKVVVKYNIDEKLLDSS